MHVYDMLAGCARVIVMRNCAIAAMGVAGFLCVACGGGGAAGAGTTSGDGGVGGSSAASSTATSSGGVGGGGAASGGAGGGGSAPAVCKSDKDCPEEFIDQPICTVVACDPDGKMTYPGSPVVGCYTQYASLFTECFNGCPGFCVGDGPGGGGMPPWMCEPKQPCPGSGP